MSFGKRLLQISSEFGNIFQQLKYFLPGCVMHKIFMYICLMYSKDLIKGTLQPIILKLLYENKKMYGYEITRKVKELTKGKIEITEGALYPTLHKLEADGILKTEKKEVGGRERKYYTLTKTGNTVVKQKVNELSDFISTIRTVLSSKAIS
jgi:PadR family transcriptional regulator PadR